MSNVNHPSHYNQGNIECIDAMVAAFGKQEVATFCKINAFKYIWRMSHKNGQEDLNKALWYLNKYNELVTAEDKQLTINFPSTISTAITNGNTSCTCKKVEVVYTNDEN